MFSGGWGLDFWFVGIWCR
jgi:hypothetical protein